MRNLYILFFAIALFLFAGCSGNDAPAPPATPAAPKFNLATVDSGGVEESVTLPGVLAAYQEVSIFPKVNGYVQSVLVDIGSKVAKGQLLMVLMAPELDQATVQAKERYARAQADYAIAKEEYARLKEAAATPGAISPLQLSTAVAKMGADSALANAEKANWAEAQTMQSYLRVTAPFAGVITIRNVHPGALVSAEERSVPMLELKEVDHLRLQVDIPENVAEDLGKTDTLSYYLSAFPGKRMTGHIARVSENISTQFRSERVELDVYNHDNQLAPGMYANIIFHSHGNPSAFVVPRSAVVTSTERKYVLAVEDGKAVMVDVSTGNQSADKTEVFGALHKGERVITGANDEIADGTPVKE